mmetsp:Transcript_2365/g.5044  ORF Transcript_2365/g.5044 Transcript_2365/m.5044 type:complete len:290 (+) Transcript_2365:586-1455(+)
MNASPSTESSTSASAPWARPTGAAPTALRTNRAPPPLPGQWSDRAPESFPPPRLPPVPAETPVAPRPGSREPRTRRWTKCKSMAWSMSATRSTSDTALTVSPALCPGTSLGTRRANARAPSPPPPRPRSLSMLRDAPPPSPPPPPTREETPSRSAASSTSARPGPTPPSAVSPTSSPAPTTPISDGSRREDATEPSLLPVPPPSHPQNFTTTPDATTPGSRPTSTHTYPELACPTTTTSSNASPTSTTPSSASKPPTPPRASTGVWPGTRSPGAREPWLPLRLLPPSLV